MISDFVADLCHAQQTVSSRLSAKPDEAPGALAKELFGRSSALPHSNTDEKSGYNLDRAFACGSWGESRPSDLFLKVGRSIS